MLLSVVTLINDQRVRRLFTADVPMSTAPAPYPINGTQMARFVVLGGHLRRRLAQVLR